MIFRIAALAGTPATGEKALPLSPKGNGVWTDMVSVTVPMLDILQNGRWIGDGGWPLIRLQQLDQYSMLLVRPPLAAI